MFRYFLYKSVTTVFLTITLIGCNSRNEVKWNDSFKEGTHVELKVETRNDPLIDERNTTTIIKIIEQKLEFLGVEKNERIIKIAEDNRIIIQLPYMKPSPFVIDLLGSMAQIEFRLVDEESHLAGTW